MVEAPLDRAYPPTAFDETPLPEVGAMSIVEVSHTGQLFLSIEVEVVCVRNRGGVRRYELGMLPVVFTHTYPWGDE